MKKEPSHFVLPLKKFPKVLDLKIRYRIVKLRVQKSVQNFWDGAFLPKLVLSGASLSILIVGGLTGMRFYAMSGGSVTPGHFLYETRRAMELTQVETLDEASDRVVEYLGLSQKRLAEAEYLVNNDQVAFSVIPQALAQDIEVELDEESEVAELLLESQNYQSLALEELEAVESPDELETLLIKIQTWKDEYEQRVERLEPRLNDPDLKIAQRVREATRQHDGELKSLKNQVASARRNKKMKLKLKPRAPFFEMKRRGGKIRADFQKMKDFSRMKRGVGGRERAIIREELLEQRAQEDLQGSGDAPAALLKNEERRELRDELVREPELRLKREMPRAEVDEGEARVPLRNQIQEGVRTFMDGRTEEEMRKRSEQRVKLRAERLKIRQKLQEERREALENGDGNRESDPVQRPLEPLREILRPQAPQVRLEDAKAVEEPAKVRESQLRELDAKADVNVLEERTREESGDPEGERLR